MNGTEKVKIEVTTVMPEADYKTPSGDGIEGYETPGDGIEGYETPGDGIEGYETPGDGIEGYETSGDSNASGLSRKK